MDDSTKFPGITTLTGVMMTNLIRGYSAYEVAVREGGFVGTVEEWLQSLVGESVKITVVEDTESSFILEFSVGDEVVRTPNLRQDVVDLKSQVRDLQTQVSHANAEIINLHTTDAGFDNRITDLESRVSVLESGLQTLNTKFDTYIDSTDVDLDQLSEIVAYMKGIKAVEIVDELPDPENADPNKIYILRSSEEVSG